MTRTDTKVSTAGLGVMIIATAIFAAAILIAPARAQVHAAGVAPGNMGSRPAPGIGAAGAGRSGANFAGGPGHFHRGRSSGRSAVLFPYPYYDSGFGYDSEAPAQPQIVVMPAAAPAPPLPPAQPIEPLLIEWQGDHFERMTLSQKNPGSELHQPDSSAKSGVDASSAMSGPAAPGSRRAQPKASVQRSEKLSSQSDNLARELPPAVLVFHDGRTEELNSYTIMSGTIYSKSDYWTTGSWTKKIQIADLDVPATLKLNHEHGLNFVLPGGPNEIVTRP